jgi:hypothetical protein
MDVNEVVARRLTLNLVTMLLVPLDGHEIEEKLKVEDLLFDGIPVILWVSETMKRVAWEHDAASKIWFFCTFRNEPRWSYHGQPLMVGGLRFDFTCKKDWVSQTVKTDLSLGYYDHLKKKVILLDKQRYALGPFDRDAWEETDRQWEDGKIEPNSFRLDMTITQSNLPNAAGMLPKIDELISEQRVDTE